MVSTDKNHVIADALSRNPVFMAKNHDDIIIRKVAEMVPEEMSVYKEDRLLTIGNRIIVPKAARKAILASLHIQHTGQTKTLDNARQLYFWPGMTKDIKSMVSRCKECTVYLPSQPLVPQIKTEAQRPFKKISIDLGYLKGTHYSVGVDRYSGFPMVQPLKTLNT